MNERFQSILQKKEFSDKRTIENSSNNNDDPYQRRFKLEY